MAPAALLGLTLTLAAAIWVVTSVAAPVQWSWGPRLALQLDAAGFGRVMAVLVPAVAIPVIGYALATEKQGRTRLVCLMVAFVGAMELLVLAADFLTLLIAWELVGALSWSLIGHGWSDAANPRQAAHAFLTTRIGDLGLYLAAGAAYAGTGELSFRALSQAGGVTLAIVAGGVVLAAAAKSAQLPFAPWLFSAMAGPTPVSALLHSATMVASGAYLLIRLAPVLQPVGWFAPTVAAIGLATALVGGLVALTQTHPKKVLAASTSAQYGLMFLAVGAGSTAAAGAHLVTHAVFKALLFLGSGVAIHTSGTADLSKMRLGRLLPAVAALSGVGALALAAVPPLGGAWSKEEIVAVAAYRSGWLGAGALLAGSLSALYALRYQLLAYGAGKPVRGAVRGGPSRSETASLGFLALASLALGALWLPGGERVVEAVTGGKLAGATLVELGISLALLAAAGAAVAVLSRRSLLVSLGLPAGFTARMEAWMGLPAASRVLVVNPVLAASRLLARFDDRVIDAGVRAAAALAGLASRLLSVRVELSVDSAVRAIAGATIMAARGSRSADEKGVDWAVEGLAQGVGVAGERARRLQTGLSHHYYLVAAAGVAILAGVLALGR